MQPPDPPPAVVQEPSEHSEIDFEEIKITDTYTDQTLERRGTSFFDPGEHEIESADIEDNVQINYHLGTPDNSSTLGEKKMQRLT